ncbi:MAG: hypothetical protein Q9218_005943 [Villophora microphyllina]
MIDDSWKLSPLDGVRRDSFTGLTQFTSEDLKHFHNAEDPYNVTGFWIRFQSYWIEGDHHAFDHPIARPSVNGLMRPLYDRDLTECYVFAYMHLRATKIQRPNRTLNCLPDMYFEGIANQVPEVGHEDRGPPHVDCGIRGKVQYSRLFSTVSDRKSGQAKWVQHLMERSDGLSNPPLTGKWSFTRRGHRLIRF